MSKEYRCRNCNDAFSVDEIDIGQFEDELSHDSQTLHGGQVVSGTARATVVMDQTFTCNQCETKTTFRVEARDILVNIDETWQFDEVVESPVDVDFVSPSTQTGVFYSDQDDDQDGSSPSVSVGSSELSFILNTVLEDVKRTCKTLGTRDFFSFNEDCLKILIHGFISKECHKVNIQDAEVESDELSTQLISKAVLDEKDPRKAPPNNKKPASSFTPVDSPQSPSASPSKISPSKTECPVGRKNPTEVPEGFTDIETDNVVMELKVYQLPYMTLQNEESPQQVLDRVFGIRNKDPLRKGLKQSLKHLRKAVQVADVMKLKHCHCYTENDKKKHRIASYEELAKKAEQQLMDYRTKETRLHKKTAVVVVLIADRVFYKVLPPVGKKNVKGADWCEVEDTSSHLPSAEEACGF